MTKDNPKIFHPDYWRYQGLLEHFFQFLKNRPELLSNEGTELLVNAFAHIAQKIYNMGYDEAKKQFSHEPMIAN